MKPGFNIVMLAAIGMAVVSFVVGAPAQEPPANESSTPPEEEGAIDSSGAQQEPPPAAEADDVRTPRQPRPEDIIREFQKQRPQLTPLLPKGDADETVQRSEPLEADPSRRPARLPDGAMITDRTGRIIRDGEWWLFVFEADNRSYPEPPMKLLPNQALERMVRESRGGVDPVVFVVTGEVTDFRAENYLLPRKVLRKRNLGNLKK